MQFIYSIYIFTIIFIIVFILINEFILNYPNYHSILVDIFSIILITTLLIYIPINQLFL